jgi:hypothetical protein
MSQAFVPSSSRLSRKLFETLPRTGLITDANVSSFEQQRPPNNVLRSQRLANEISDAPPAISATISFDNPPPQKDTTEAPQISQPFVGAREFLFPNTIGSRQRLGVSLPPRNLETSRRRFVPLSIPAERVASAPEISLEDIERELVRYEYQPVSRIQGTDPGGDERVKYIKALNKYGQYVFIELDGPDTVVTIDDSQITHLDTEKVYEAPSNVRAQVARIGSEFIRSERASDTRALLSSDQLAHPVVRLSEIRNNPQLTLQYENQLVTEMRNTSYGNLVDELYDMSTSINKLVEEFNLFNLVRNQLATDVRDSLASNRAAVDTGNVVDRERELNELKALNGLVTDLILCTRRVVESKKTIDVLTDDIRKARKQCEEEYEDVAIEYGS